MKWIRNVTDKHPKVKIIMTNFLFFPEMYIIDCEYSRQVLYSHQQKANFTTLLYGSDLFFDLGIVATRGNKWKA